MVYDELPSRGKVTHNGEKTKDCKCGGRCYVFYDENRFYHVECEKCGIRASFTEKSQDNAIRLWNESEVE